MAMSRSARPVRARAGRPLTVAVAGLFLALAAADGRADGGGDGGGGAFDTPTCGQGFVWDPAKKECVRAPRRGELPDDALAAYAWALTKEERFQEALDVLALVANPNTPQVLNYRGYATRKLGRVEEGIAYYLEAVKLDADYTLVREYLGEAYAETGRLELAREQLDAIRQRCGTTCEPYQDLAEAIDKHS